MSSSHIMHSPFTTTITMKPPLKLATELATRNSEVVIEQKDGRGMMVRMMTMTIHLNLETGPAIQSLVVRTEQRGGNERMGLKDSKQ